MSGLKDVAEKALEIFDTIPEVLIIQKSETGEPKQIVATNHGTIKV